jgi:hypothetical protein
LAKRLTRPSGKRLDGTHYLSERTHCIRNHPLVGDNVIERHDAKHPNGGRMCRTCSRERARLDSRVRYWRRKWHDHKQREHSHRYSCKECLPWFDTLTMWRGRLFAWQSKGK